jgi:AcrR family transcriptional regulator
VSKNQWLAKALEALESGGVDGVKIEKLARALGISRSGFYWHVWL